MSLVISFAEAKEEKKVRTHHQKACGLVVAWTTLPHASLALAFLGLGVKAGHL